MEYYRWVAAMENLIKEHDLSLRKLHQLSFHPSFMLKNLALLVEQMVAVEGCEIISVIN